MNLFIFVYLFIWLHRVLVVAYQVLRYIMRHCSLWRMDSLAVASGLSCSTACGILVPWLGIEPASPALQGGFLMTGPPGKSPKNSKWSRPSFAHSANICSIPKCIRHGANLWGYQMRKWRSLSLKFLICGKRVEKTHTQLLCSIFSYIMGSSSGQYGNVKLRHQDTGVTALL